MKQFITCLFIIFITLSSNAQNTESDIVQKGMIVMRSTKNYNEAKKFAEKASKKLSLKLDLRELTPNKQEGLTFSQFECEDNGWEYPCYIFRGRYDDGEYISIEYSNGLNNFTEGIYIVIAASGDNTITQPSLKKIKKVYKNAYVKQVKVNMGCIH
jgi:hypothetical protein